MSGGHTLAALIEGGRLESRAAVLHGLDLVLDEVEGDPEAALVGDEQLGELARMVRYGLDGAELCERLLIACAVVVVARRVGQGGHTLEHKVFADDAGHERERGHVEHVHVARLEAHEQVRVVVEEREGAELGAVGHVARLQRALFALVDDERDVSRRGRVGAALSVRYLPEDEVELRLALVRLLVARLPLAHGDELMSALDEEHALDGKRMHVLVGGHLLVLGARRRVHAHVAALGGDGEQLELLVVVDGARLGREALVRQLVEREQVLLQLTAPRRRRVEVGHRRRRRRRCRASCG